jgi:hypothetical protein
LKASGGSLFIPHHDKLIHKGEAVGADGQFAKPDMELMVFMKETVEKRRQAGRLSPFPYRKWR